MRSIFKSISSGFCWVLFGVFSMMLIAGCDNYTEVELPNSQLTGTSVFETTTTANAAMANVYAKLRDGGLLTGLPTGISNQLGNYIDELTFYGANTNISGLFNTNALLPSTRDISIFWNASYNQIYACNAIIEGVTASQLLPEKDKLRLKGEALFVRALIHFYLTNLYGTIPYIRTTNYQENTVAGKISVNEIYDFVITDLLEAITLLPEAYQGTERVIPNRAVAKALLSRVFLYYGKWEQAAESATDLISDSINYPWEPDLGQVFLKEAKTTIWQFSPVAHGRNTAEGATFIFFSGPPSFVSVSPSLLNAFEDNDLRKTFWIKEVSNGEDTWYHPYKYREQTATAESKEYSIVFRMAEQYLIRAEARAMQGDLTGAKDDLNQIRHTAGLENTSAITQQQIIEVLLQERQVEFFTEFGHRFFDLKRRGKLDTVLSAIKPGWNTTDALWPLPETELLVNPNILPQNPGY